ncbi:hypothetical protein FGG15_15865 [Flagellimonas algicola]|uniref:ASPIC/UnbV domain-containing protein n=1 Tax=Flagellimonas algicola TaxID=2583815 RepID=A0ABY2WM87_9FLAO|nr:hypothetical protein FGG15_15865 [Allomuricauda algicola]
MISCKYVTSYTLILLSLIGLFSCSKSNEKPSDKTIPLFTEISSSQSGIGFVNEIPENSAMNSMVYEYFYNGGGVAIGDVDNDGLADIYFTANLKENKLYKNLGDFKFEDITAKAKVKGSFGWTTGVTMADINADGWLDIYICKSGKGKAENRANLLYINNKNGTFSEMATSYGLDFSGYSTQASFFDYDRDGDLDLFLLNHNVAPVNTNTPEVFKNEENELVGDRLYRNDNGKFTNISKQAGIIGNSLGFGLGVSIGDLNNDGWPDIYVGNDYIEQDYLYYNNRDGTFTEGIKTSMGHTSNFSMGTDIADINNDGLPEVISLDMVAEDNYGIKTSMSGMDPKAFNYAVEKGFHYQYMYNALHLNNGDGHFSEIAQMANVSNTDWSWAPLLADFDNDGQKDLFVTNGLKRDFRNNDFKKYKLERLEQAQNRNEKMPKVIEELVQKTPQRKTTNYLFRSNGDLTFTNKTSDWGIQTPTFSNGAAYGDLDNDGDLDLVINNIDQAATVLRNNSKQNYIQFEFKGPSRNPFGVGTIVTIETNDGQQFATNYPTRGYQSAVQPLVHFGLSQTTQVEKAAILWPDGKSQTFQNLGSNQRMHVDYGKAVATQEEKNRITDILFQDITDASEIKYRHTENFHDDFALESLLPHKMSQEGPALAVGDINQDGLDDFYIGGAKGYSGALYVQQENGKFHVQNQTIFSEDKIHEDVDAAFFDVDKDGDLDLYVASGSNEEKAGSNYYLDRIYVNENGLFSKVLNPFNQDVASSSSIVRPYDYDKDGDLDLFVGGRQEPGKYPLSGTSVLWRNDTENGRINFTSMQEEIPDDLGMVTDAAWADVDGDGFSDLILVGEWMSIKIFKNHKGSFTNISDHIGLENQTGWWFSLEVGDFDADGDMDFVAGNLGLNSKYQASSREPFEIYAKDFDQTGSLDIVLGYHQEGKQFPLRGRECSSNQMPFIKKKFPTYHDFASASLEDVYGKENLATAVQFQSKTFASAYFENQGDGSFTSRPLPNLAQQTAVRDIIATDFTGDGLEDLLLFGNLYGFEVETPRQDAGYGLLMEGNGSGSFEPQMPYASGLYIPGDVSQACMLRLASNKKGLLVAKNNDYLQLLEIQ